MEATYIASIGAGGAGEVRDQIKACRKGGHLVDKFKQGGPETETWSLSQVLCLES